MKSQAFPCSTPGPSQEKRGSYSAGNFTKLSVSKAETPTGSKHIKKKKKKQKEVTADSWGRHSRATAGHCLRSWSEINLTGSELKPCTQTSRGFLNREKHSAEIYLLALQCQRPKIHYFQTFQLAQDTDQRAQQVSLNANVNVRSTSLHKASTPPPFVCVF